MARKQAQIAISPIPGTNDFKFKIGKVDVFFIPASVKGENPKVILSVKTDGVKVPPDAADIDDPTVSVFEGELSDVEGKEVFSFDTQQIGIKLLEPKTTASSTEFRIEFEVPGASVLAKKESLKEEKPDQYQGRSVK